jgi:hypothetical protein
MAHPRVRQGRQRRPRLPQMASRKDEGQKEAAILGTEDKVDIIKQRNDFQSSFQWVRFTGQMLFGNMLSVVVSLGIPHPEEIGGIDLAWLGYLLRPLASAVGIWIVGNIGRQKVGFKQKERPLKKPPNRFVLRNITTSFNCQLFYSNLLLFRVPSFGRWPPAT